MSRVSLVSFENSDGLILDGILYFAGASSPTVLHVHGSLGNFYANKFVQVMGDIYGQMGINFLSFNLTSHDGIAEGYFAPSRIGDVDFSYVGGSVSTFDSCLADIDGAANFVSALSSRVVLQGHSLGCDRVLHYLTAKKRDWDFVLLSPCDSYQLHCEWIAPETPEDQVRRIRKAVRAGTLTESDWLPEREYGLNRGQYWTYPIPIKVGAWLSIADGPPLQLLRIDGGKPFHLSQRSLVYLGGRDSLVGSVSEADRMFRFLESRVATVERVFLEEGDHSLEGHEADVAGRIARWITPREGGF